MSYYISEKSQELKKLIVELEELKNSPEKLLKYDFNEYIAELGNSVDVIGQIVVELMPYGVKIKGQVSTDVELICDRCLSSYNKPITIELNEDYLFDALIPEGVKEYELQSNELVNELNGQTFLDITDIVYQSIILELPNQNLCDEKCPGTEELQSLQKEQEIDPRLEKFKYFNSNN